ncbi:MAG: hypothetical protein WBR18_14020 [Anaerolineales bacterium]
MSTEGQEPSEISGLDYERGRRRLIARWPWIPAAIIIGGLAGLIISWLLPPTYRATASLGIGIDYGRTHVLSPEAEREALFLVQELLLADETLRPVLDQVSTNGAADADVLDLAELRERVRIERYEGRWDLSVASSDPGSSAQLTNVWAESAVGALQSAVQAAMQVRELQGDLFATGCQLQVDEATGEAVWTCSLASRDSQREIAGAAVDLLQRSHGVLPGLTFAQLRTAVPPEKPVARSRLWLIIGGILVGLSIGTAAVMRPGSSSAA